VSGGTILKQFYDAVRLRDMAKARTYLDDNMTFAGLFETYPNANAYIATYTQLMQIAMRLEMKTARA
jgi:hypothetical protein